MLDLSEMCGNLLQIANEMLQTEWKKQIHSVFRRFVGGRVCVAHSMRTVILIKQFMMRKNADFPQRYATTTHIRKHAD